MRKLKENWNHIYFLTQKHIFFKKKQHTILAQHMTGAANCLGVPSLLAADQLSGGDFDKCVKAGTWQYYVRENCL